MAAAPINVEDWRRAARRRLPRLAFDYIEGGVEDEVGIARNEAAFREARILPRYLVDVSARDTGSEIFGRRHTAPLGIAPMGMTGLFRHENDLVMAAAAQARGVPLVLSASGNATVEEAARVAPGLIWFQIYCTKNPGIVADQARRAHAAGVEVLVLTVDVPVSGKRERNLRNGFARPLRLNRTSLLNLACHPAWTIDYLRRGGLPPMKTFAAHAPPGADPNAIADFFAAQTPAPAQTWKDVERLRRLWPGRLVVKGLLHPADAVAARDLGADGIVVSNHGGRQLDRAPATLEALPAIRAAVGEDVALILDSGVRRGADIAVALALGARFVLCGRAVLYGAVAGGVAGATSVIDILRSELATTMGQIGCAGTDDLATAEVTCGPTSGAPPRVTPAR